MATLDRTVAANGDDGTRNASGTLSPSFPAALVGEPFGEAENAWFRFANITVPQGATITTAHIVFQASDTGVFNSGTILSNIFGIDEDDHAAPTTNAQWVTDHGIHTTASTVWDFAAQASGALQTPSIVPIIQEIVDRAGWVSGADIGIHVDDDGTSGSNGQELATVEAPSLSAAILHIEYTAGSPATATPAAIAVAITVPGPSPLASSLVTPGAIAESYTLPAPTLLAASLVTPGPIAVGYTAPTPTIVISKTVTPDQVDVAHSLPTPAIVAASIVEPLTIDAIYALPTPTPSIGQIVEPGPVDVAVSVPAPVILAASLVTPAAISEAYTVPGPTAAVEALRAPGVIALVTTVPTPGLTAGSTVTPMAIEVTYAIPTPGIFAGVLEIIAKVFGQFHRKGSTRLHLAKIGRGNRRGFRIVEGWERVSDPFIFDEHADGDADQEQTMTAVAAAWAAHAGSSEATLKAAIHSALDALGYRRPDGTRLT